MSKNKNDITGDSIITHAPTEKFSSGWDAIWGSKKVQASSDEPKEDIVSTKQTDQ